MSETHFKLVHAIGEEQINANW